MRVAETIPLIIELLMVGEFEMQETLEMNEYDARKKDKRKAIG